ncbi:unnamed protein product [Lupinus luteus]|uniref:3-hydroxyisobutyryl-CoA hydrolase n=1 Tax=Lupinus luteus TaxID=3873 RepID=A0AAV1XS13_LUPLU
MKLGHWTYPILFYKKQLTLDHLIATYKKPMVFAMPEASIGHFPDVGANYFLSRLPGYFGEYLGLTGARLHGAEIVACGLATHFVPSMIRKGRVQNIEQCLYRDYIVASHFFTRAITNDLYEKDRKHIANLSERPKVEEFIARSNHFAHI